MTRRRGDAWAAFGVGLLVRLLVVAWARGRFPPAGDGYYYDVLARRLASGAGYTWLWPDGAVTYAAHYPVGYPALLGLAYRLFGASDTVAMALGALFGAAAGYATHRLLDVAGSPRWSPACAAFLVALHPALVPYAAARMTEGVTATLLVVAAAAAARSRRSGSGRWAVATAVLVAFATLVRPQSLVLAPVLGALTLQPLDGAKRRAARAAMVTLIALACIAPWTVRNCARMGQCALVSVNEGWNLLIGATTTSGAWQPLSVPPACATVWDEAAKDRCFEREAKRIIAEQPATWLARVPAKIATTFDLLAAAPWYLHASNAQAFGVRAMFILGGVETVVVRATLIAALVSLAKLVGPRRRARTFIGLAGTAAALTLYGWISYACIVAMTGLLGPRRLSSAPIVVPATAAVVAATLVVHAVFFGAGRYGLVVIPFVAGLAFLRQEGLTESACAPSPTGAS